MKTKAFLLTLAIAAAATSNASRPKDQGRQVIYVNSEVTTLLTMPENIKMVDISTGNIAGNQCSDNMVRIKPVANDSAADFSRGEFLGSISLIGERHMAQYDIVYETNAAHAMSYYSIPYAEAIQYSNPEIRMPEEEMSRLAWTVYGSKRKFHNIRAKGFGIDAQVYNIYSAGNYFFIDFNLKNNTNIPYEIAEMRVKVSDKKETKASNYQSIELTPAFALNRESSFNKSYRQVLVLERLTFPNEKVLQIEISESQISGRVLTLTIDYNDILNADGFDMSKVKERVKYVEIPDRNLEKEYEKLLKANSSLQQQLAASQSEARESKAKVKTLQSKLDEINRRIEDFEKRTAQTQAFFKSLRDTSGEHPYEQFETLASSH